MSTIQHLASQDVASCVCVDRLVMIRNAVFEYFYMQFIDDGTRRPFSINENPNYFFLPTPPEYEKKTFYYSASMHFANLFTSYRSSYKNVMQDLVRVLPSPFQDLGTLANSIAPGDSISNYAFFHSSKATNDFFLIILVQFFVKNHQEQTEITTLL